MRRKQVLKQTRELFAEIRDFAYLCSKIHDYNLKIRAKYSHSLTFLVKLKVCGICAVCYFLFFNMLNEDISNIFLTHTFYKTTIW